MSNLTKQRIEIVRSGKVKEYEVLGYGDSKNSTHRMWVIYHKKCGFVRSLPPMDNFIICHHCKKYFKSSDFIKLRLRIKCK